MEAGGCLYRTQPPESINNPILIQPISLRNGRYSRTSDKIDSRHEPSRAADKYYHDCHSNTRHCHVSKDPIILF
jgi:hypothetical protein